MPIAALKAFEYIEQSKLEYVDIEQEYKLLGEFRITSYCPCAKCCGRWAYNRPNGIVYTASGARAEEGTTVGVDPGLIPYGTQIYIEGVGIREAQDTGQGYKQNNHIDVYFNNHSKALNGYINNSAKVYIVS